MEYHLKNIKRVKNKQKIHFTLEAKYLSKMKAIEKFFVYRKLNELIIRRLPIHDMFKEFFQEDGK